MNRGAQDTPADSRYGDRFDDVDKMSAVLDLEDLDEIETFFMFLWSRPLSLSATFTQDDTPQLTFAFSTLDGRKAAVDVTLPTSLRDIMNDRSIADVLEVLGPYDAESRSTWDPVGVHHEDPAGQIEIMRDCLGRTHLFSVMYPNDAEHPDG